MRKEQLNENTGTENGKFIREFLKNAPEDLQHSMAAFSCEKGKNLILADDTAGSIYILLKGCLKAIDEHGKNGLYPFTEIYAPDIVGDFELFSGKMERMVTLKAMTRCEGICMSIKDYQRWIRQDANALYIRLQLLMCMMTDQSQNDRKRFLITNEERIILFLAEECEKQSRDLVQISYTHTDLADHVGCSLRTVNRVVKKLEQDGMFHRVHGKICLNREEQERIRGMI